MVLALWQNQGPTHTFSWSPALSRPSGSKSQCFIPIKHSELPNIVHWSQTGKKKKNLKRGSEIFWREAWQKPLAKSEMCAVYFDHPLHCPTKPPPPPLSLVQSLYVHNSAWAEALLLLDVVICMDLKRRWGGFPGHSWVTVTREACWIKKLGLW